MVFHGRGLIPRPGHSSRNPSTPPKNFPGVVRGYQEPSGARQTGTGQSILEQDTPQEQEALRGQSSEAEASSGHDMTSGALTGSLSNRFHICDRRGRRLGMASTAMTRGAACPRRVSVDTTRHDWIKTAPVDTTRLKNGTPGRNVWTGSTGLGSAAAGRLESAAIWRA